MKTMNSLLSLTAFCTLASLTTPAATLYVWQGSPSPASPYTNWATAAHTIQQAVDAAQPADTVLVTNGVYSSGGKAVGTNVLVNRVAVDKPITLRSVHGPQFTLVVGAQAPGGGNGEAAIRCMYLTNGALASGFTLTNGATRISGDYDREQSGGGLWCQSTTAIVSNCVLRGNLANGGGAGAFGGTLNNCCLTANWAYFGGGASSSTLYNCMLTNNKANYGGGEFWGTLSNCTLTGNQAWVDGGAAYYGALTNCTLNANSAYYGGGASWGTLDNCTLTGNWASSEGGGAEETTLDNCTLTGNSATFGGGAMYSTLTNCALTGNWASDEGGGAFSAALNNCTLTGNWASYGGGAYEGTLNNCIVYSNTASYSGPNYDLGTLNYCCTTPAPGGLGNITDAPLFLDLASANLRLQSNSPCINKGNNSYVSGTIDLDGRPRIVGGRVDMGAYEYQGAGMGEFIAWLQRYGLPMDGSADATDHDHDGQNNWQEWQADTNPTNAASCLRLSILSNRPPVEVRFSSSAARLYTLQCSTNLTASIWTPVPDQTDIPGNGDVLILTDTNSPCPAFYRVSVRLP